MDGSPALEKSTLFTPGFQAGPSSSHDIETEGSFLTKTVRQHHGETPSPINKSQSHASRAWSSIKNIPDNISIFCRAACKVILINYYLVKHKLIGIEFTSGHLRSCIQALGPAYGKIFQSIGADEALLNKLADYLGSTAEEQGKFAEVIRDVLGNNPKIPDEVAKSILDNARCEGYKLKSHMKSGTIGSCFEVEKEGESHIAKVIPSWKANDLVAGILSMKMLFLFLPKNLKSTIKELTDPFLAECSLAEERRNLIQFKEALESVPCTEELDTLGTPQATITFKAPRLTQDVRVDNLLLMEKVPGDTLDELTNPQNHQLRSRVYQTCFGTELNDDDNFLGALRTIHEQTKEKWRKMAINKGVVHCDCHPGNIMLSFNPGRSIDVWFIDFGNVVMLTKTEQQLYPEVIHLISDLANPFMELDDTKMNLLVNMLWNRIAVVSKDNSQKGLEEFKRILIDEFNSSRVILEVIEQLPPEQGAQLQQELHKPMTRLALMAVLPGIASTKLSGVCQKAGVQLPPSFTRFIAAHFKAGAALQQSLIR